MGKYDLFALSAYLCLHWNLDPIPAIESIPNRPKIHVVQSCGLPVCGSYPEAATLVARTKANHPQSV